MADSTRFSKSLIRVNFFHQQQIETVSVAEDKGGADDQAPAELLSQVIYAEGGDQENFGRHHNADRDRWSADQGLIDGQLGSYEKNSYGRNTDPGS